MALTSGLSTDAVTHPRRMGSLRNFVIRVSELGGVVKVSNMNTCSGVEVHVIKSASLGA